MSKLARSDIRKFVKAVISGDTDRITSMLDTHAGLATAQLSGNPRSMLHHATDWPGHRPNVATTIALLVAAGAEPNVAMPTGENIDVAETPMHWAASSNDVAAIDALVLAGADVDVLGGIFGGCTPYEEAIIFEQYAAARRLLVHGATNYLPGAAALGQTDQIDDFFDANGDVRTDAGVLPHWNSFPPRQTVLDRAFQFACRAGHIDIAERLFTRGADPTAVSPAETTAREEAENNGHDDVVAWLDSL